MMPALLRIFLFSLFLNLALQNAYAGVCDLTGSGIGGTGTPVLKNGGSGIGGTGAPVSKHNGSGIGGTGQKTESQTAVIIGTITGFGSICVNGIEIHYDGSTPVQIDGETTSTDQLALGQVVSVQVSGTGNEVFAKDIHVMNVVSGPIAEIDSHMNRVTVLGQRIQLSERTHYAFDNVSHAGSTRLQKGSFIQVSGLRQADGKIVASRIVKPVIKNTVRLSGIATNVTVQGFMIGTMNIETDGSSTIKEGQEVTVDGRITAEKIIVRQLTLPTIVDNQRLNIEGFVRFDDRSNQIKIGHVAVQATEQIKQLLMTLDPEQSVIIDGTVKAEDTVKIEHMFIKEAIDKSDIENISKRIHKGNSVSKGQGHSDLENEQNEQNAENEQQEEKMEERNHAEDQEIEKDSDDSELSEIKTSGDEIIKSVNTENEKPELETDEIEIHEDELSEVNLHEHESPEIEAPKVEVSEVEVPEVEAPEVETPEVEVPEVEVPEVEVPEVEVPEVEVPEVEVPEVEVPEVEVPEVEVPEVEVPEVEVPEVEVPEVEVPEVEVPEVEVPEVEVPEVEVPEVEEPEIEIPEIEDND